MSNDELAVMDGGKRILQAQGVRPFFSDKFNIIKHPQYKYLLDSSKKNAFDIAKYLRRRLTVRPAVFLSLSNQSQQIYGGNL